MRYIKLNSGETIDTTDQDERPILIDILVKFIEKHRRRPTADDLATDPLLPTDRNVFAKRFTGGLDKAIDEALSQSSLADDDDFNKEEIIAQVMNEAIKRGGDTSWIGKTALRFMSPPIPPFEVDRLFGGIEELKSIVLVRIPEIPKPKVEEPEPEPDPQPNPNPEPNPDPEPKPEPKPEPDVSKTPEALKAPKPTVEVFNKASKESELKEPESELKESEPKQQNRDLIKEASRQKCENYKVLCIEKNRIIFKQELEFIIAQSDENKREYPSWSTLIKNFGSPDKWPELFGLDEKRDKEPINVPIPLRIEESPDNSQSIKVLVPNWLKGEKIKITLEVIL